VKDAPDLSKGLTVEKICGEQVAVFCSKLLESEGDRMRETSEFRWNRQRVRLRRGSVESIERRLAVRSSVMIDMTLGERSAKPTEK
jgi:hypothetical protein